MLHDKKRQLSRALAFSKNITGRSLMNEVHKKMRTKESFEDERPLL